MEIYNIVQRWPSTSLVLCMIIIGVTACYVAKVRHQRALSRLPPSPRLPLSEQKQDLAAQDAYSQIVPLSNFDWKTTEPLKIRPFKPKYHLTMALENITMSDLIAMDKTYLSRIALRRQLMHERAGDVLAANTIIEPAVQEFYTWLFSTYLPRRFPTVYEIQTSKPKNPSARPSTFLRNLATNEAISLEAPPNAIAALRTIGAHIDTDFLFLLPSEKHGGKFVLEGFVTCFPSGFNTPAKLNLKLADIHAPVPGYGAKLEKSMDRFFASLPVGKIVRRQNWAITTKRDLHMMHGTHGIADDSIDPSEKREEVDVANTVLRCERQTLHRLPQSKALVFQFKTYQYELDEIKEEGNGEALAQAIDGLGEGSVPAIAVYKKGKVWGPAVKEYLLG